MSSDFKDGDRVEVVRTDHMAPQDGWGRDLPGEVSSTTKHYEGVIISKTQQFVMIKLSNGHDWGPFPLYHFDSIKKKGEWGFKFNGC